MLNSPPPLYQKFIDVGIGRRYCPWKRKKKIPEKNKILKDYTCIKKRSKQNYMDSWQIYVVLQNLPILNHSSIFHIMVWNLTHSTNIKYLFHIFDPLPFPLLQLYYLFVIKSLSVSLFLSLSRIYLCISLSHSLHTSISPFFFLWHFITLSIIYYNEPMMKCIDIW